MDAGSKAIRRGKFAAPIYRQAAVGSIRLRDWRQDRKSAHANTGAIKSRWEASGGTMVFGQKINRRNALTLMGAGGVTVLAATAC